ncbi:MAG: hypothetical protein Fur0041_00230 [Bacteroidia bacterium]
MIGKQILQYRIVSLIGEGGMGNVWLAEHMQLPRKVAIKSLHQHLVKNDQIRHRFKNEAALMVQLQHPGIVSLYDYFEDEDGLYLIMEYVDGMPLDDYIRKVSGPIPEEKAASYMYYILEAFAYAHSKGIVHRDIKPSNILILNDGKVKVLDFGIAKLVNDANNKLTRTGTQLGTVFYMSPEQVQGQSVDHRSDIYALGVTFFQMLTGQCPYEGMTTEFEVFTKIVNEPLSRASSIYPGVSVHMEYIIETATAKTPAMRFQDCVQFSQAIAHALKQPKIAPAMQQQQAQSAGTTAAPEKKSSLPVILTVAGVGLAMIIFFIVYVVNKSNEAKNSIDIMALTDTAMGQQEPYAVADTVAPANSDNPLLSEVVALVTLQSFYQDIGNNNLVASAYFAPNVARYINLKNTTPEAIQEIYDDPNMDFVNSVATIDTETFHSAITENGMKCNYTIEYTCFRPSKGKTQHCFVDVEVEFNESGMISSYKELEVRGLEFY